MKRILLILMVGFIVPTGLNAQKVYKDVNGKVILDMTVAAGMPEGAVRTTKATTWPASAPTVYNVTKNGENGTLNATVYQKLEISKNDPGTKKWADAWTYCQGLNEDGKGWRLPTQRELQMIWIFKTPLENLGVGAFSSSDYWSATESSDPNSWVLDFSNGNSSGINKPSSHRVRCVREL